MITMSAYPEFWLKFQNNGDFEGFSELALAFLEFGSIYLKYFFMIIFIITRAYEHRILNMFILYQKNLRLEDLDVNRDLYQNGELKFQRMILLIVLFFFVSTLGVSIYEISTANSFADGDLIYLYWICVTVCTIAAY